MPHTPGPGPEPSSNLNLIPTRQTLPGSQSEKRSLAERQGSLLTDKPRKRRLAFRSVRLYGKGRLLFCLCAAARRSPKVTQLKANPRATLVLWCPNIQQQLRLSCSVSEVQNTSDYWRQIAHSRARLNYATKYAPGSPLNADLTMNESLAEQNFCVLQLNVETIDRLWISHQGHRRQRIAADSVIDICP